MLDGGATAQLLGYVADAVDNEALAELLSSTGMISDLYAMATDQSGDNINIQLEDLGKLYRELGVKARLEAGITDEEMLQLLASDGMLVKRPVLLAGPTVRIGFREPEWEGALL